MSLPPPGRLGVSAERHQIARWASTFSAWLEAGFVLLGPDGQVDDATPTACELFGAADPDDLRTRWSAIHDTLAPLLRERVDVFQIADISSDVGGQSRRVRCEVYALTQADYGGHLLLVQSSERVAALEGALHLASRYQTLASLYVPTAHDLRGSLHAMTLNVELLARTLETGTSRERDAEVQQHCVEALRQELDRFTRSIGNVLDEVSLDQAQESLCRLPPVLESVVSLLRAKAERQHVTLRLDVSSDTIDIMGRASEIRQAVLNLAHNALEAMPQGGELSLNLRTEGPVAVLTVSDTGPGVPGELGHSIWNLYFSTKPQGRGIGLHVVKSVAHAHGGTVTLDRSDSGAQFTIRLPLAR